MNSARRHTNAHKNINTAQIYIHTHAREAQRRQRHFASFASCLNFFWPGAPLPLTKNPQRQQQELRLCIMCFDLTKNVGNTLAYDTVVASFDRGETPKRRVATKAFRFRFVFASWASIYNPACCPILTSHKELSAFAFRFRFVFVLRKT